MNLQYNIKDKPSFKITLLAALQQLLAILAATIAVPAIIGHGMSQSAALFGAGIGTIIYLIATKFRSPIFLGSSFAFLGSMSAAFAGAISVELGYVGLILGTTFAGLVYCILAYVVKKYGTDWINTLMPAVVIGPTVSIIGLSLAGNSVSGMITGFDALACGLITLFIAIIVSVYGKKILKTIPFIIGIMGGYVIALILTLCGNKLIDFSIFKTMDWIPDFTFLTAVKGLKDLSWSYVAAIAVAYVPVSFVVLCEHIADHKNLSTIVGCDLLKNPGLHRTLVGDGLATAVSGIFSGSANCTYGESLATVAISGNAATRVTLVTALLAIVCSFFAPLTALIASIPTCVMSGATFLLYGFIAVSGLKMIQDVDLNENSNLFTVSVILIAGIGGMVLDLGLFTLTSTATALILGIVVNYITHKQKAV